ncbi:MAG: multidrug effflux MFS transporter [Gammaproteobacteria bacterium]|nr:multidrug effflux MFS transporter [Gammaproteobacteria bacterium]
MTLLLCLIAVTIPGIAVDLYAPSLPSIAHSLNVSVSSVKLTISTFLLGFSLGQAFFGTFSDTFGRKPLLMIGLIIFVVSSFVAVWSTTIAMLSCMRVLQGIGSAAVSAITKSMLADTQEGKRFAIGTSYLTVVWSICPILAPILGGYIQYYYGWQMNFYFYGFYSLLITIGIGIFLKETIHEKAPFNGHLILEHIKEMMVHPVFVGCILTLGIGYSIIIIFNIVGPFLIQKTLGYNAVVYGHVALIVGAAFFLGTSINRVLLQYLKIHTIMSLGTLLILIAGLIMIAFAYETKLSIITIVVPFCIIIIATGFTFPNALVKAIALFPHMTGTASSVTGVLFIAITTITSILVSFIPQHSMVPVAWFFVSLITVQVAVYLFLVRRKPKAWNK